MAGFVVCHLCLYCLCIGPGFEPEVNPFGKPILTMEYLGLLQLCQSAQPRSLNPALVASVAAGAPLGILRDDLRVPPVSVLCLTLFPFLGGGDRWSDGFMNIAGLS